MEQTIKFEFTVDEANVILNAVAQLPYGQVAGLIENIRRQAAPQVQQVEDAANEAEVAA